MAKRIGRFIFNDGLIQAPISIKQWVGEAGFSDQLQIFLELDVGRDRPPSPFKFCTTWLEVEEYRNMVRSS